MKGHARKPRRLAIGTLRTFDDRTNPPGNKPKAPGERLPVPAGWRFGGGALRMRLEGLCGH